MQTCRDLWPGKTVLKSTEAFYEHSDRFFRSDPSQPLYRVPVRGYCIVAPHQKLAKEGNCHRILDVTQGESGGFRSCDY
jgi:hypothetical protein